MNLVKKICLTLLFFSCGAPERKLDILISEDYLLSYIHQKATPEFINKGKLSIKLLDENRNDRCLNARFVEIECNITWQPSLKAILLFSKLNKQLYQVHTNLETGIYNGLVLSYLSSEPIYYQNFFNADDVEFSNYLNDHFSTELLDAEIWTIICERIFMRYAKNGFQLKENDINRIYYSFGMDSSKTLYSKHLAQKFEELEYLQKNYKFSYILLESDLWNDKKIFRVFAIFVNPYKIGKKWNYSVQSRILYPEHFWKNRFRVYSKYGEPTTSE